MTALGHSARALTHATVFLDPERMRAWLRRAQVGASTFYAKGPSLEGGRNPAAVLAREWHAAGLVDLVTDRQTGGVTHYLIVKRGPVEKRGAGAVIHSAARQVGGEQGAETANCSPLPTPLPSGKEFELYMLLVEAAEAGADCPGHGALADALDLTNRQEARYLFKKLEAAGHVRQIEPARYGARVIEIVATGLRTRAQGVGAQGTNSKGELA